MKTEPLKFISGKTNDPDKVQRLLADPLEPDAEDVQAYLQSVLGYTATAAKDLSTS